MGEKVKTLQEIAQIANINVETLRLYLSRCEFNKYVRVKKVNKRWRNVYLFNNDFKAVLCKFLELKRRYDCAKLLVNYKEDEVKVAKNLFQENEKLKIDLDNAHCENKKLQDSLEMAVKQHEALVKKYHEVLKLAKENADSNEFCLQELEQENEKLKKILVDCGFWKQDGSDKK